MTVSGCDLLFLLVVLVGVGFSLTLDLGHWTLDYKYSFVFLLDVLVNIIILIVKKQGGKYEKV